MNENNAVIQFIIEYGLDEDYNNILKNINIKDEYILWSKNKISSESFMFSLIQYTTYIECDDKELSDIPDLQSFINLKSIDVRNNYLTQIPKLPYNIESLNISNNEITNIDNLPENLKILNASKNYIKKINNLPPQLEKLNLNENNLIEIIYLPDRLTNFSCEKNLLTEIPRIPKNVEYLNISDNCIQEIPKLPDNIKKFICQKSKVPIKYINNSPSFFKKITYRGYEFKNREEELFNNSIVKTIRDMAIKIKNSEIKDPKLIENLKKYMIYAKKNQLDISEATHILKTI